MASTAGPNPGRSVNLQPEEHLEVEGFHRLWSPQGEPEIKLQLLSEPKTIDVHETDGWRKRRYTLLLFRFRRV